MSSMFVVMGYSSTVFEHETWACHTFESEGSASAYVNAMNSELRNLKCHRDTAKWPSDVEDAFRVSQEREVYMQKLDPRFLLEPEGSAYYRYVEVPHTEAPRL